MKTRQTRSAVARKIAKYSREQRNVVEPGTCRACGKLCFKSKAKVKAFFRNQGLRLEAYRCRSTGIWHGTTPR